LRRNGMVRAWHGHGMLCVNRPFKVFTTRLPVRPNETMQRVEAVQTSPRFKLRVSVTWF